MRNLDYLFYDSSKSDEQYRNSELPVKSSMTCENNNKSLGAEERYLNPFFKGQDSFYFPAPGHVNSSSHFSSDFVSNFCKRLGKRGERAGL